MRILVTDGMDAGAVEQLKAMGHDVVEQFYESNELGAALRDFDVAVIRSATKIQAEHIEVAKGGNIKLLIRAGVGIDNIDKAAAEAAGIKVTNTPMASSNAVAELAMALLFSCARNISIAGHTMREEKWEKKAYSKGFEIAGKTVGVVGYGRIGRMVGDKCQALGANVLSYVHRNKPEGCECDTMKFVSQEEVFAQSDILILCAPNTEGTLITADSMATMKDGVVIINVSRGANVDEGALLAALESGKVAAAGIDVWLSEKEPNWALASFPTVSCTPHIGAGTKEAQKRIGAEIVEIISHF